MENMTLHYEEKEPPKDFCKKCLGTGRVFSKYDLGLMDCKLCRGSGIKKIKYKQT